MKRPNLTKVREIQKFLQTLQRAGIDGDDEFFAQVKQFKATTRDHKEAKFPGMSRWQQNYLFAQAKRNFNVSNPNTKIISSLYKFQNGKKIIRERYLEIAYGKKALEAKEHQDKINNGGIQKSKELLAISQDHTLQVLHRKRLSTILIRAGIN